MPAFEVAGLVLGVIHLIVASLEGDSSGISRFRTYEDLDVETELLSDALENFREIEPKLEHLTSIFSAEGDLSLSGERRQSSEKVLRKSTALANIVAKHFRDIEESRRRRQGIFERKRSRAAVQELILEVDIEVNDLKDGIDLLSDLVQRSIRQVDVTTVEDDVPPFENELDDSAVYRKKTSEPSGLGPIQFEEIIPNIPHPDPNSHRESPKKGEDEADAADWSTTELYSGEKNEAETDTNSSFSIVSAWRADARSVSNSYEDRLPHRSNNYTNEKVIYEVLIYDEGGNINRANCLLDTDASLDCISKHMADRLKLKTRLKRLRNPVKLQTANRELLTASFVVESIGAFVNKPTGCYKLPLYVLKGLPHDMCLSDRTIFQWKFLLANLETSLSFKMSTAQEGFEKLLPLGLPKQTKDTKATQNQATEDARKQNEEQRNSGFEELKRQAAEKRKQAAEGKKKERQGDADVQGH